MSKKSEVLDLRASHRRVKRVFDIGDGLPFKSSLQVDEDVGMRTGLRMQLLQLLERRVVQWQVMWTSALGSAFDPEEVLWDVTTVDSCST